MTVTTTGEMFTRRWVVEFMLDMAGYVGDVSALRVVEPSVGTGAFIGPIVERLIASGAPWEMMADALVGYDLKGEHVEVCRSLVIELLRQAGCPIAEELAHRWVRMGDFLLTDVPDADLVIGNPPYIRIENLDPQLLAYYRHMCPTMKGRADIFVGFFERGLDILKPEGRLVYICADRWMRNGYGKALRGKVIREFAVNDVLVMHDAPAFEAEVSAYPAIVVLQRGPQGPVTLGEADASFDSGAAAGYLRWRNSSTPTHEEPGFTASRLTTWHSNDAVWPDGPPAMLSWLRKLDGLPRLEEAGVKLGIGIATGADAVYISRDTPDVEADRLVPMATPAAIRGPRFEFTGEHLVSPWQGRRLVDIRDYPRLHAYFNSHAARLKSRNVARRTDTWWRTIDSFNADLLTRDLLVMQDLKRHAHPVRVPAGHYPHHGLTWFSSEVWDLDVLGGLLLSQQVEDQVAAHCVRMRGGTLRFQPTVLRMVRIPPTRDVSDRVAEELSAAFLAHDPVAATAAAATLFPAR